MINVNQMTSQLARMPDQALQQYAQMHKNDPYIMALAMSESNRRKSMRTGAQMNAPEEPKVVDQAIQSMASPMPEDVGIGQLPAGEMNFAGGGIVAFSDGGDVPRYQDRGLVQGVQPYENNYDRMNRLRNEEAQRNFTTPVALPEEEPTRLPGESLDAYRSRLRAFNKTGIPNFIMRTPEQLQAGRRKDYAAQQQEAVKTSPIALPRAVPEPSAAETAMAMNAGAFKPPPVPPAPPRAAPKVAAGPRPPVVPAAPAAAASSFAPSQDKIPTMDEIKKMYAGNMPKPGDVTEPFASEREALTNLAVFQNAEERAALDREIKERGVLGAKQEARLKAREEKLGKQEKDIGPLAMLQAGFAIMSGSSRSALQNIGAGAQVGLKGYTEGIEKLQTARERIEDGLERIETARRSEGVMDNQQRRALRKDGNEIVLNGKRDSINALTKEFDVKRTQATSMVNAGITALTAAGQAGSAERLGGAQMQNALERTAMEQAGQDRRTAVTAGAPLALLRAVAADPKLQAVYGKGPGGQNKIMDEYNDFVKANPQYLANEAAGMQAFLRAKGALSSLGGAGAAGSVSGTPTGKVLQ
jgi:hypothetical protein